MVARHMQCSLNVTSAETRDQPDTLGTKFMHYFIILRNKGNAGISSGKLWLQLHWSIITLVHCTLLYLYEPLKVLSVFML